MTIPRLRVLAALDPRRLATIIHRLATERSHGRPWSLSLRRRVLVTCIALRTNLTFRELAALCGTTKSTVHRIVAALVPRLARLAGLAPPDRRWSWIVDGTLIPTRDHAAAARSKNYRWSCNAQVLVRRDDLRMVAVSAGGPGNRNDPIHYRGSAVEALCKSHGRVLADGGYRGVPELIASLSRHSNRTRCTVAAAPTQKSTRRARNCVAQELAGPTRPPTTRPESTDHPSGDRRPSQSSARVRGQPLAGPALTRLAMASRLARQTAV